MTTAYSRAAVFSAVCSAGERGMTVPMQAQFLLGLQSILLGASLGLFYDILRAFGCISRPGAWLPHCMTLCSGWSCWRLFSNSAWFLRWGRAAGMYLRGRASAREYIFFCSAGWCRGRCGLCWIWPRGCAACSSQRGKRRAGLRVKLVYRKNSLFYKKFAKPSSIFRRKGIK